ncbi:FAD-dependent oxidoreductase [Streptomyces spiramenti]|uniref:FAD-binding oxidoreductase n=1 Tax=Streptomyces spiramenti TaxID=2720606 RepID=A0ABX1AKL0_9ACTN|nr:FAD-binding oxidoreductase [Streptomyces spiramenti]
MSAPAAESPPWSDGPTARAPRVAGSLSADVVVVGAGLAGLATAHHLLASDPSADVVVVDALRPAAGASGRGTGLLGPRVGPPIDVAARRFGPSVARAAHLASEAAVARVIDLAAAVGAPAGLRPGGQIVATRTASGLASLARQDAAYRSLGLTVPVLSAADIRRRVGVPYHAGLLYRGAATLDPAAFTHALATACAAAGARFHHDSPLLGLRPGTLRTPSELRFAEGTLRARKVVLAVNADADRLGLPVGTVLPLRVHAVATAPLAPEVRAALGGADGASLVDGSPTAPYFRLTPDGGLVVGGGRVSHAPRHEPGGDGPGHDAASRVAAWRWLEERLRRLHPGLVDVPVAHRWSGRIGMTVDGLPVVGRVGGHPDIWYIGGCCGHGLAMSVAHGRYVASHLTGPAPAGSRLPWHRDRAPRLPLASRPARALLRAHLRQLERAAHRTP